MSTQAYRWIPTATALLTFAAGCQHIQTPFIAFSDDGQYLQPSVGDGLVADPASLIPDVPMPVGFRPVASQSTSSFDGQVRTVHHVYQGHAQAGAAAAFYQNTLPTHDWGWVDTQNIRNTTTSTYTKGAERLTLQTRFHLGVSTITVQIHAR